MVINVDPAVRPTLSVDETAIVLGISRALAYQGVRAGEIPVIRVGTRLRIPTAALARMLNPQDEHAHIEGEVRGGRRDRVGSRPAEGS